ncbi:MAG: Crp/Fnr family transcriptional regulator [Anaerolineae bacterium]
MTKTTAIKIEELRQIPALAHLTERQLAALAGQMVRRTYDPGALIFLEGEEARGLWFVFEGRVKIIKQSLHGRTQGLCMMHPGKCFGSCPLFEMDTNPATAQAIDRVTLFVLPEADVERLATRESELVGVLLQIYSQRLGHLARISELLATWTVQDRINDVLVSYAQTVDAQLVVDLTHEKLAALAGTVREVVSRHLSTLEKSGQVRCEPGRVVLLAPDSLVPPCFFEAHTHSEDVI